MTTFCLNGISSSGICCDKSCGHCGGTCCDHLPGGSSKCCQSTITNSGIICQTTSDTGCIIPGKFSFCFEDTTHQYYLKSRNLYYKFPRHFLKNSKHKTRKRTSQNSGCQKRNSKFYTNTTSSSVVIIPILCLT